MIDVGETIPKSDPCLSCHCDDGDELCASQSCAANCANPIRRPGVCCPVCPDGKYKYTFDRSDGRY